MLMVCKNMACKIMKLATCDFENLGRLVMFIFINPGLIALQAVWKSVTLCFFFLRTRLA